MTTKTYFEKFYENIKLTSQQREDAKKKYDGVCKKLHDNYYPDTAYNGQTRFLIGSYGKQTHVRPARDIDVIFQMPPIKFEQYDDNKSNGQSQLLQDIKKVLEKKYPDTSIKAFGKVVVLEFSDPQHNVELLPAWENDDKTFIIPNSENGGSWETCNPRGEIKEIKDSDEETGKTKVLIRMIKKWTDQCSVKVKSYKIEKMVVSFFDSHGSEEELSATVRDFFEYFHNDSNDESLKSHLNTALNRAKKACEFEKNDKLEQALDEWRKIFGNDFPKNTKKGFENSVKYDKAPNEEFIENIVSVKIDPTISLKINCKVKQDGFRPAFLDKIKFLSKNKNLEFFIEKHNITDQFEIKWKVRNFDEEAKNKNDLRGEISDDLGFKTKKENTKYKGEHYVECYILKSNICIARGKITVPISNI